MSSANRLGRFENLAVQRLSLALFLNGKEGISSISTLVRICRQNNYGTLAIVLQRSLDSCLEKGYLNPNIEHSRNASDLEVRKFIAYLQKQLKYIYQVWSPLPAKLYLRKPALGSMDYEVYIAGSVVREAIQSMIKEKVGFSTEEIERTEQNDQRIKDALRQALLKLLSEKKKEEKQ